MSTSAPLQKFTTTSDCQSWKPADFRSYSASETDGVPLQKPIPSKPGNRLHWLGEMRQCTWGPTAFGGWTLSSNSPAGSGCGPHSSPGTQALGTWDGRFSARGYQLVTGPECLLPHPSLLSGIHLSSLTPFLYTFCFLLSRAH